MSSKRIAQSYQSTSVETASPAKIILMLFDGALKFLSKAQIAFKEDENKPTRNEEIHNNLVRVTNIICELQSSLDLEKGGEFAQTMYSLYDYIQEQIISANIKKDTAPLTEVEKHLKEIRSAWAEMMTKNESIKQTKPTGFSSKA